MEPVEFEKLRKLLALKRHEVPPPGYFEGFSAKVVARIRAGEAARPQSLWSRWMTVISTSPAISGVFALAMLAFVVVGVNVAHRPRTQVQTDPPGSFSASPAPAIAPVLASEPAKQTSNSSGALLVNADADSTASNSAPAFLAHPGSVIVSPAGSLHNAETQQVNFPK